MICKRNILFIFLLSALLSNMAFSARGKKLHTGAKPCFVKVCDSCAVSERADKEALIPLPYIAIAFYKPNYILPYYYTGSPANAAYMGYTPNGQSIKSSEVKYQLSFKVPLWKDIFDYRSTLYFAYSHLTYWQVYSKSPFIRETDYEPEFFFRNEVNYPLIDCWMLKYLNLGYTHESNGWGNSLQRSWDRIYGEAITYVDNWMFGLRAWYIAATHNRNDDIANYLGYGSFLGAFKYNQQVFSLQISNLGADPRRTSVNLTWSFPITAYVKGYAEVFSGYGQSLIEYDHHTNSAGVGFAVSDWL